MGKGSYNKLREDALKSVRSFGLSKWDIVDNIQEFLDKYAPDSSLDAQYIYENTRKGNNLPYALQELAVSVALRNKGYDSLVGYSKTRGGEPFMSELVDLREDKYPNSVGGYSINPEFKYKANKK